MSIEGRGNFRRKREVGKISAGKESAFRGKTTEVTPFQKVLSSDARQGSVTATEWRIALQAEEKATYLGGDPAISPSTLVSSFSHSEEREVVSGKLPGERIAEKQLRNFSYTLDEIRWGARYTQDLSEYVSSNFAKYAEYGEQKPRTSATGVPRNPEGYINEISIQLADRSEVEAWMNSLMGPTTGEVLTQEDAVYLNNITSLMKRHQQIMIQVADAGGIDARPLLEERIPADKLAGQERRKLAQHVDTVVESMLDSGSIPPDLAAEMSLNARVISDFMLTKRVINPISNTIMTVGLSQVARRVRSYSFSILQEGARLGVSSRSLTKKINSSSTD